MEFLSDPDWWGRWLRVVGIDLLLAGDNALVIALAVRNLSPRHQLLGRIWGTAGAVMRWLRDQNIGPAFIAPGRPWQNGYVESFHGKLRDECLNREWFRDAREARVVIELWRHFYNHQRPHSALGYRAPAQARQAWIKERNIEAGLTA